MSKDALKDFVNLRQSLITEREILQKRLRDLDAALGGDGEIPLGGTTVRNATNGKTGKRGGKRLKNPMSLRAAMLKVTSDTAKTKQDILAGVKKLGYRFAGKNPINSINVVLYSKPKFKNENGKFSPGK